MGGEQPCVDQCLLSVCLVSAFPAVHQRHIITGRYLLSLTFSQIYGSHSILINNSFLGTGSITY